MIVTYKNIYCLWNKFIFLSNVWLFFSMCSKTSFCAFQLINFPIRVKKQRKVCKSEAKIDKKFPILVLAHTKFKKGILRLNEMHIIVNPIHLINCFPYCLKTFSCEVSIRRMLNHPQLNNIYYSFSLFMLETLTALRNSFFKMNYVGHFWWYFCILIWIYICKL